MGFDVTYHPMTVEEAHLWYFDRLPEYKVGDRSGVDRVIAGASLSEDARDIYEYLLAQVVSWDDYEATFEESYGFALAAVQGVFRTYYYTRNVSFTSLVEEHPEFEPFFDPVKESLATNLPNPVIGAIEGNYCSGKWISPAGVFGLLGVLREGGLLAQTFNAHFKMGMAEVVRCALIDAENTGSGILEASEIMEPNPIDLTESECLSYLLNCDFVGPYLYHQNVVSQLKKAGLSIG